jgi:hypothetical protein
MADDTPARLRIGGEITQAQYQAIQRLTDEGAQVSFGHCHEIRHDRARWGAFEALEAYLIEQQIPFDRYSEPALGYDGRLAQFRPGMDEPAEFPASGDTGEWVVPVGAIRPLLHRHWPTGPTLEELVEGLRTLCGPVVAPLPKFSVGLG